MSAGRRRGATTSYVASVVLLDVAMDMALEGMALGCEFAGGSDLLMLPCGRARTGTALPYGCGTRIILRVSL